MQRAPVGTHILWAYCHVPRGSSRDMTDAILAQVERFAPGFQDVVLAVNRRSPADLESDNPNHVGGDITGGELSIRGLFARPKVFRPYRATRGYTCAQRRRLQAQGCTECAESTRQTRCCGSCRNAFGPDAPPPPSGYSPLRGRNARGRRGPTEVVSERGSRLVWRPLPLRGTPPPGEKRGGVARSMSLRGRGLISMQRAACSAVGAFRSGCGWGWDWGLETGDFLLVQPLLRPIAQSVEVVAVAELEEPFTGHTAPLEIGG